MKKRIFGLLLALSMLISCIPIIAYAKTDGTCGDNLTWTLDDDGTLTISGTGDMMDCILSMPWGSSKSDIKNVVINSGVTSIGEDAFCYCTNLTSIEIPSSVTSIGTSAFLNCDSLTRIDVDGSNQYYCSVDGNLFSKDKTELIRYAIGKKDTSYTFPNGVTRISDWAFGGCDSLVSIIIPDSVTSMGSGAFRNCSSLTSVTIPNSVTSIGEYAFYNCSSLKSVTIPNSITSIDEYAFSYCSSLTSIEIPNSVTSIGKLAFNRCGSLNISVDSDNKNYLSVDGVLFNKDKTVLISYTKDKIAPEYTIPNSVTSIGDWAFCDCDSLINIIIPYSVISIRNSAFKNCESLTSIEIPNSVTSIGNSAFCDCKSLTSVTIPNSVTSINDGAFRDCSSLTNIAIPNSVTSIGKYAFSYCKSLTSITIPDSVKSIGEYAFCYCSNVTNVTISNGIINIGDCAFRGCRSLTSIEIPSSVTSIGKNAFYDCSSLRDVYYTGTKEEWNAITIGKYNDRLTNAAIHCNSVILPSATIIKSETDTAYTFNVQPLQTAKKDCCIYAAVYDEKGVLNAVNGVPLNSSENASISVNKSENDNIAKIFIFADTLQPLAMADKIPLQ